jgi:hypothetical protein
MFPSVRVLPFVSMVPAKNLDDYLAEADKELYLAKNRRPQPFLLSRPRNPIGRSFNFPKTTV